MDDRLSEPRILRAASGPTQARRKALRLHVLPSFLLSLCLASEGRALPFSQIVAFGDSYSDTGNAGRSADGPMWVEYLAQQLEIPGGVSPSSQGGSNYSVGGAAALRPEPFHFQDQLDRYLDAHPIADPDALFAMWIGFNDIQFSSGVTDLDLYAQSIVDVIRDSMESLWSSGARHFLVPTAWDYATTPVAQFMTGPARESRRQLSLLFNDKLEAMLDAFEEPVFRMDAYELSLYIDAGAWRLGFTEGRYGYCGQREDCSGFVWKDQIHPSSAVHEILAERAYQGILEDLGGIVPEPGTGLLVGLGLVLLGAGRRRLSEGDLDGGRRGDGSADRARHWRIRGHRAGVREALRRAGMECRARGPAPRPARSAGTGDSRPLLRGDPRPARRPLRPRGPRASLRSPE
ncbi:MAG: SGNH/GDSL hydrolase family protein [Deltaproteobacteria bacterium]|nr:SGNH/GDSL hydrolase family protein [Deltaproteobacteria bacterium]